MEAAAQGHLGVVKQLLRTRSGGAIANTSMTDKVPVQCNGLESSSCCYNGVVITSQLLYPMVFVNGRQCLLSVSLLHQLEREHSAAKSRLAMLSHTLLSSARYQSAELQAGKCAADIAQEQGHMDVAQHLMNCTDRIQPHNSSNPSQGSAAPSAPPWWAPSPYQAALHQSTLPHTSSASPTMSPHHDSSPQAARSARASSSSSAATSGTVSYPAVYTSSSMQNPSGLNNAPRTASRPSPLPAQQATQPQQQEGGRLFSGNSLQAEAVQADTPKLGHIPAAVSFMLGKLQVRSLVATVAVVTVTCMMHRCLVDVELIACLAFLKAQMYVVAHLVVVCLSQLRRAQPAIMYVGAQTATRSCITSPCHILQPDELQHDAFAAQKWQ